MLKIGLLFIGILLLGCEKPNPNPELGDSIYGDLTSRAEASNKAAEAEKKKLEGFLKEIETAKPQTGDARTAHKRFFETERKIKQIQQEQYYFTLRARSRKDSVKRSYMQSFLEKKPWDTSSESESYDKHKEAAEISSDWDSKRRIANYTKETGIGSVGEKKAPSEEKGKEKEKEK